MIKQLSCGFFSLQREVPVLFLIMSLPSSIPYWKRSPFIRILLPLTAGILLQWYCRLPLYGIVALVTGCVSLLLLSGMLHIVVRYRWRNLQGIGIQLLLLGAGSLLVWKQDERNRPDWYGRYYLPADGLLVQIDEPPVEKNRTYKAEVKVLELIRNGKQQSCRGRLLVYITKDSAPVQLHYGDRLLLNASLQPIKNSGNPGAFNYKRYSAFHGLHHTAFLQQENYRVTGTGQGNVFRGFIYRARDGILAILREHLQEGKDRLGIAEALLIGYTQDLDKDLVQAYSNTGVVHVIAISGMHLGLIYILLLGIFKRIPYLKRAKWIQLLLTLAVLWLFSLLTGASASVLRAAVMFSCIGTGKLLLRQANVYNSLAASAFILLCYDPFYLWDVGFQLSYLAVIGILLFQSPLYHLFYIKNKWVSKVWELMAVSLSAQVFTFPVCLYYFHQFPNFFLLSNLLVVPLSGLILYTEILLLLVAWIPVLAGRVGLLCSLLVDGMNRFVRWVNAFPFAVWDGIPATVLSTWLLYAVMISVAVSVLQKKKKWVMVSLFFMAGFCAVHCHYHWRTAQQRKLLVYQVPRYQAIDFIEGNRYYFSGDSALQNDGLLKQFHLRPGRIDLQTHPSPGGLPSLSSYGKFYCFAGKRIAVIDTALHWQPLPGRIRIDLLIISKNPRLHLSEIIALFDCGLIVVDASNSKKKTGRWEQEARILQVPFYNIVANGAFEYDTR